jgi:hypothetical protein
LLVRMGTGKGRHSHGCRRRRAADRTATWVRLNDYGLRYVVKCVLHTMWSVRSGHCGLTSRMREMEKEDA